MKVSNVKFLEAGVSLHCSFCNDFPCGPETGGQWNDLSAADWPPRNSSVARPLSFSFAVTSSIKPDRCFFLSRSLPLSLSLHRSLRLSQGPYRRPLPTGTRILGGWVFSYGRGTPGSCRPPFEGHVYTPRNTVRGPVDTFFCLS